MIDRWWRRAKCRGMDPALFFPERGEQTTSAIACCNGDDGLPACPVIDQCRQDAIDNKLQGVFGGVYFSAIQWQRSDTAREIAVVVEIRDSRAE